MGSKINHRATKYRLPEKKSWNLHGKVQRYLKECYGQDVKLTSIERLGEGVHGAGYLLKYQTLHEEKHVIMKTLFPSEFGHDHFSDRAQVLLLANATYNEMRKHVRAIDVVGETPDRLISMKDADEFYFFMEAAQGDSYFEDLNAILRRGRLTTADRDRVKMLASLLAEVHNSKYCEENAKILYRRRIRDLVGHGECIMGIIDTYDRVEFISEQELLDYASKCLSWWRKIRNRYERLCEVHGDFHPGNIWFQGDDFTLLDRSRGRWGEPADDLSCLGINYIYYAIKDRGNFSGPFAKLFKILIKSYLEKTKDYGFFEVSQPFFAFRILVLANPKFYPEDTREIKRKLINFGQSVLETERFEISEIQDYIDRK